ncbi:nuclear transport factor 2 family protein [Noviherbaspirillum aerium]|uniref:nuclear transport factor 2 family protein n=1 Tax=Noviherbaspirillum aerium TaxID=2588497 RepID=UPI001CEFA95A
MNIEQLVASEAICTTKARYCHFIDLKRWDDLRQLCVPDARLTFRGIDGQVLY